MSEKRTIWIDRGLQVSGLDFNPFRDLDMPFRYYNLVEVTLTATGTEIRWDPACAQSSSIQNVIDRLPEWNGPYVLKFFKQGWFTQTLASPELAARRIVHIQSLGNVEPLRASYVKRKPVDIDTLLPSLRSAHRNPDAFQQYAVEDVIDDNEGTFEVASIGTHSTFRKYVCRLQDDEMNIVPGNEQWISEIAPTYRHVLEAWKPKHDHVMALLTFADEEPVWLSWHRLVRPMKRTDGKFGVQSFVVPAPVDISIF